ncbi:MAG: hypothetical protein GY847_16730 [Proteobacteria bacterium]|nr:hypothetical protein [Pseudomonadota bacterium]
MKSILTKVTIPTEWTGEQATAVVEFLDEISTVIWEAHDHKIVDTMNKRESQLEHPIPDEDEGRPLSPEDDLYCNRPDPSVSDDDYPF